MVLCKECVRCFDREEGWGGVRQMGERGGGSGGLISVYCIIPLRCETIIVLRCETFT